MLVKATVTYTAIVSPIADFEFAGVYYLTFSFLILATSTDVVRIYGITTFAFSYVVCRLSSVSTMKLKKTLTLGNFHILFWNLAYLIFMAFFKDSMKKNSWFFHFYTPSIWKKDLENFQWFFTMKFQTTLTMGNFVLLFSNLAYLIFRTCLKDCAKKIHDFSIFYTPSIWKKKT